MPIEMNDLVVIGVALVVVAFVIPRVSRFLWGKVTAVKGSLALELHSNSAQSGDRIYGRVTLQTRLPVNGLLRVALVGWENRQSGGQARRSRPVDVYRDEQVLEETRRFPDGFSHTYEFEFTVPASTAARKQEAMLQEMANLAADQESGAMASVLKLAATTSKRFQRRIYWKVETRLEADGIDLADKQRITVALKD